MVVVLLIVAKIHGGLGISTSFESFTNETYQFIPSGNIGADWTLEDKLFVLNLEYFQDAGKVSYMHLGSRREMKTSLRGYILRLGFSFLQRNSGIFGYGAGIMMGWAWEKRPVKYWSDTIETLEYREGSGTGTGIFFSFEILPYRIFKKLQLGLRAELSILGIRTIKDYDYYYYDSGISFSGTKLALMGYYDTF